MIQKHFLSPTIFYKLFIDIRVTLVINIITLRPLYMYTIFLYYTCVYLYHSFIVILSFSQYCQICYITNSTGIIFLGGHVISTSIYFYMVSLAQSI